MSTYKRVLSILAVLVLALALMPGTRAYQIGDFDGNVDGTVHVSYDADAGYILVSGTGPWSLEPNWGDTYDPDSHGKPTPNRTRFRTAKVVEGVTSLPKNAFAACINMTSIVLPSTVTMYGEGAFSGCKSLTEYEILPNVSIIGTAAFSGCTGLEKVTIGDGVRRIGNSAFANCEKLSGIQIPDSVRSIGDNAFIYCINVTEHLLNYFAICILTAKFYPVADLFSKFLQCFCALSIMPSKYLEPRSSRQLRESRYQQIYTFSRNMSTYIPEC